MSSGMNEAPRRRVLQLVKLHDEGKEAGSPWMDRRLFLPLRLPQRIIKKATCGFERSSRELKSQIKVLISFELGFARDSSSYKRKSLRMLWFPLLPAHHLRKSLQTAA